jgi:hypothetical protein
MLTDTTASELRVAKERVNAIITLSTGEARTGAFFVARASAHAPGPERVGELMNAVEAFFPFEIHDGAKPQTLLVNRAHVVTVALPDAEARRDPGYDVATERFVSVLLSTGRRVSGSVRIYCPDSHNRLSDWARHPDAFRYIETPEMTLLVNIAHVIEASEVAHP